MSEHSAESVAGCEYCTADRATHTLLMTDSTSVDALSFVCTDHAYLVLRDWLYGTDYQDVAGWEVKRLLIDGSTDG